MNTIDITIQEQLKKNLFNKTSTFADKQVMLDAQWKDIKEKYGHNKGEVKSK